MKFSEEYGRLRSFRAAAKEARQQCSEEVLQSVWYDQLFREEGLCTHDGQPLRVLSPGWWNRSEGPDFKGAQFQMDGRLITGDVEIHWDHAAWRQHGHYLDSRYDDVALVVVFTSNPPEALPATSQGRSIPCLLLSRFLDTDIGILADSLQDDHADGPLVASGGLGQCAAFTEAYGKERAQQLLFLAGEWRMLAKARGMRERMDHAGGNQAIYEAFLSACGFSRYKTHFRALAKNLPYERVRQLALRDPLLLEAALLQLAGLFPEALPEGAAGLPHFARLRGLRRDELGGLKSLPLDWKRIGVRPNNYPERRLAGAALFLARTAHAGLEESLRAIWTEPMTPAARKRRFEGMFGKSLGFWASHCCWTGKRMAKPAALLGPGRILSIIGNVFVPVELAYARRMRDHMEEEQVFDFFGWLPKEEGNHILKAMLPRFFGDVQPPKLGFRTQQGLMQLYQDWCEPNPSCRNCSIIPLLDMGYRA